MGCGFGSCGAAPTPTVAPTPDRSNVRQIIDAGGDGAGHDLDTPESIAVDTDGTAYVAACGSSNVFKISSNGTNASA